LKEYALLGSGNRVVGKITDVYSHKIIDGAFVTKLITSKNENELHKRLKSTNEKKHTRTKPRKTTYF